MKHEDGFCDACGCEVDVVQLTHDGRELCVECTSGGRVAGHGAKRPEARDDGR